MTEILCAREVGKTYQDGDGSPVPVLAGLNLDVAAGEFVAIVGASGAGKSTLLHLLGALDQPSAGTIVLEGQNLGTLTAEQLAHVRTRRVGFVFQFHHLLRDFTAVENVMMPLLIAGTPEAQAADRARGVLTRLGLDQRVGHYPSQLSGGERQRIAVARAVAIEPAVVLADEPSGNLDPTNAGLLHEVLASLRERFDTAVVVATHNQDLANRADRILRLDRGGLIPEGVSTGEPPR